VKALSNSFHPIQPDSACFPHELAVVGDVDEQHVYESSLNLTGHYFFWFH
jgi:hypothetical protein